jgi:predicted amidophosphoribosyltransferase
MDSVSGKFCPVCKHKNQPGAIICSTCGSPLEFSREEPSTTRPVNRRGEETNALPQVTKEPF